MKKLNLLLSLSLLGSVSGMQAIGSYFDASDLPVIGVIIEHCKKEHEKYLQVKRNNKWYGFADAIKKGSIDTESYIKKNNLDLGRRKPNDYAHFAIGDAILWGKPLPAHVLKVLVNHGFNINQYDQYGETLLHHAARQGDFRIFRALAEAGADLSQVNSKNKTALQVATDNVRESWFVQLTDMKEKELPAQ